MILLPPACSHLVHVYFRLTGLTSPVRYVVSMDGLVMVAIWRSPFGVRPLPSAPTYKDGGPDSIGNGRPGRPHSKKTTRPQKFRGPRSYERGPRDQYRWRWVDPQRGDQDRATNRGRFPYGDATSTKPQLSILTGSPPSGHAQCDRRDPTRPVPPPP